MVASTTRSDSTGNPGLVGKTLDGRYEVTERLGEGAMSAVYRAKQPDGPDVAIKVLHEELGDDTKLRERFEREARALFALQHPHVLEVYDFGIVDGAPYLVMELLQGATLDVVYEDEPPPVDTALELARQILNGLSLAHAQGVLHRDLKTENVFVTRDAAGRPVAKLLDFGLVKFVDEDRWGESGALTTMGSVFGTPAYMAPEQVTGQGADARSDVYAAGVILFELITGLWPFMEEERLDMFRAHLGKPVPLLGETRPDLTVSDALENLVQRALAKRPADRFQDAGEMLRALEALPRPAASPKPSASHPAPQPGAPHPAPGSPAAYGERSTSAPTGRSPSWLWWVLGGVAAAIVLGVALGFLLLLVTR
jgi:serine/threonine-protein kinase